MIDGAWSLGRVGRQMLVHLMNRPDYKTYFYPFEDFYTPELWSRAIKRLVTLTPWELELQRSVTFCSVLFARQKRYADQVAAYFYYEFNSVPRKIVAEINSNDLVYVTSNYVRDVFQNSGVTSPIRTVGHGFDPAYYKYEPRQRNGDFLFLCVGENTTRKNLPMLIRAFEKAFKGVPGVRLLLKLGYHGVKDLQTHITQPSKIQLLTRRLADESKLAQLYHRAHCFVLPTRGEGFGMPMLEAMATGLPVITTNHGGHLDFCAPENSCLINCKGMVECDSTVFPYIKSTWAEPDEEHLTHLLQETYKNYDQALARAAKAFELVQHDWTWDAQLRRMFP